MAEIQPGLYVPYKSEDSKFVPQSSVGVDYMLVSPEGDTSKKIVFDREKKENIPMQLPFKNVNTTDLTTGNLSALQGVGGTELLHTINFCQMVTSYYNSDEAEDEKVKYDLSEAQTALTNFLHAFASLSKSGPPRGGMLLEILKSRIERTQSFSQEYLRTGEEEKKKGLLSGWK